MDAYRTAGGSSTVVDAVVVGAGPNGLAAALTLAREGFEVVVLEAAEEPGGGTRSIPDPEFDGIVHDHCSAVHPFGIASPFLRELPLERHGLEWCHPEIAAAHPLDDEPAAFVHRDLERTVEELGEDGPAWRRVFGYAAGSFDALASDLLGPVIRVPRRPLVTARGGPPALLPASIVARTFRTERGRALFAGIAAHVIGPLGRPMTTSVGMMMGAAGHAYGWPFPRGGSQSIWRAMASYLEELGGEIRTGVHVESLRDLPRARVALFDVTPTAMLRIAEGRTPRWTRRAFRRWTYGPAAFKVDYVLRGGVPWADDAARRAGTVHLGGTFEEIAAAEAATARGEHVERPFVLVAQPQVADPGREVDGLVPLWTYAHVPHGSTRDATGLIDAQVERFAPGFADRVIARRVTTPAQFEEWNPNLVGGDIAGGASSGGQLIARPRLSPNPYRTGIPGVFLCSSSTPPGAGVHGMCGHNAARDALRVLTS